MTTNEREFGPGDRLAAHIKAQRDATAPLSMNGLADSALQGVTVSFLAQVFRIDNSAVKRKLVNCPILESRRRGTTQVQHLYDLATAAKYLVDNEIDAATLISRLKREDLPPAISTAYWDALLKKQKFEENAGDLWRTEKVWEVLSTTFQNLKFTMQLWPETIERLTGLTDEQRELLQEMVDGMQQELFNAMVKQAKETRTGSQLDEVPDNMKIALLDDVPGLDEEALDLL
jgi:hypothetical protein